MNIKVVSPKGEVYSSDSVYSITLPTKQGVITVKKDHCPLISLLDTGELEIENDDHTKEYIFISSGIIRVERGNNIYIMCDTSEFANEIDVEGATQAKENAEKYLKNAKDISDAEFARIQGVIEKEVKRIEIARLRGKSKEKIKIQVEEN